LLGGLLKIGHASYPTKSRFRLLPNLGNLKKVPVVSG
jgi:hypothetical protein